MSFRRGGCPPERSWRSCHYSCIDHDAQGETIRVLWEAEIGACPFDDDPWSRIARDGTDDAEVFAAYLRSLLSWRTANGALHILELRDG